MQRIEVHCIVTQNGFLIKSSNGLIGPQTFALKKAPAATKPQMLSRLFFSRTGTAGARF